MRKFNWGIAEWLIPFLALCVTTDQWTASTGSADPYQLTIAGAPFSIMAAARGISIVLTVTYALYKVRTIRLNASESNRVLLWVLVACIVLLLATEALVITPYTMTVMAKSETGITLMTLSPILFYVWALFVSDAALVAVITAGLASLVVENVPQAVRTITRTRSARPEAPPEEVVPAPPPDPLLHTRPIRLPDPKRKEVSS